MTTFEMLTKYVEKEMQQGYSAPIYRIIVFEHPNQELIYPTGKASGFPDLGSNADMGFYYELKDAVNVMHTNAADIRETVYNAGFVLCQFPGLYQSAGTDARLYFVWDEEKQGFFEQEEPEIFSHIAY